MIIDAPRPGSVEMLRMLWKEAFGDSDAFLDAFFSTAFRPEYCRCVFVENVPVAVLYWFNCTCRGKKLAYIYAVATSEKHRGQGLCRSLVQDTHACLKVQGYSGAVLVPGDSGLAVMYRTMGYEQLCQVREFDCCAGVPVPVRRVDAGEYAVLRRQLLPADSVVQEGANLEFLQSFAQLYAGDGFLLAAQRQGDTLTGMELLGDVAAAPGILTALGCTEGHFRTPGAEKNFAMYHSLDSNVPAPAYFGLAFD